MTELSADLSADSQALAAYRPVHTPRFVTATALFDGQSASIHVLQRLLTRRGAEVIHLGQHRSVDELVSAALQEDVQGIAVGSCQDSPVEYFRHLVSRLRERGGEGIAVFGGVGGVISPAEIRTLAEHGVRLFSPEDGQRLGLAGMVGEMLARCDRKLTAPPKLPDRSALGGHTDAAWRALSLTLTALNDGTAPATFRAALEAGAPSGTGTGTSHRAPPVVVSITGSSGACKARLADELIRGLRLDARDALHIALLSIGPSRRVGGGAPLTDRLRMNAIAPWPYPGAKGAHGDGSRVYMRSLAQHGTGGRDASTALPDAIAACSAAGFDLVIVLASGDAAIAAHVDVPLHTITPTLGTTASPFNHGGVSALYQALAERQPTLALPRVPVQRGSERRPLVAAGRERYLCEIADAVRSHTQRTQTQAMLAREAQQLRSAAAMLAAGKPDKPRAAEAAIDLASAREARLDPDVRQLLEHWRATQPAARFTDHGELLEWLMLDNLPGRFPYTAGATAIERPASTDGVETPTHLSIAFDAVTLCGHDPALRPEVYGQIGHTGASIATLDDMAALYSRFDLTAPDTVVSMAVNGPAPTILAMFLNVVIDQSLRRFAQTQGREPSPQEAQDLRAMALAQLRGSVHSNLFDDVGQSGRTFSTPFSLDVMGDTAEWFVQHGVRNFAPQGIAAAEAGSDPVAQLAMTLAKGFTHVEAFLARGLRIDDFAPQIGFFFSSDIDAEHAVLGRVARRIWAVAMRTCYGAAESSQKLRCSTQATGCGQPAQAVAQAVSSRARGLAAFETGDATDRVEDAVLAELDRISKYGGVMSALEMRRHRSAMEMRRHRGRAQRTFAPEEASSPTRAVTLTRSTDADKQLQLKRLADFHTRHAAQAPAMLARLQQAVLDDGNVFDVLMDAVRVCSLGQITNALLAVGAQYRRSL